MTVCKKCGNSVSALSLVCPECKSEILLSNQECIELYSKMCEAKKSREYENYYPICQRLADAKYLPALREWGRLLESGELGEARLDEAMRYFKLGAMLYDAYSAFRYSRLVSRESDADSDFWLLFAALLGSKDAAPLAAKLLDECGNEEDASYYYTLSAKCDNIDSIVTLAKRYTQGLGVPKSDSYAKWYMDKLSLPPIHALGLAYKLRGAVAKEPPEPHANTRELIIRLIHTAKLRGFVTVEKRLTEMLSELGDVSATARLGIMYAEGIGTSADSEMAKKLLELAATHGIPDAYKALGDYHLSGILGEPSPTVALEYYRKAAELGHLSAYQLMGDMYFSGELVERNIARAAELYRLAARDGDVDAMRKYEAIEQKRNELFERAVQYRSLGKHTEAFTLFTIASAMGHEDATLSTARAYIVGDGTDIDRRRAFKLLSEASEHGNTGAYFPLALCYSRGVGTRLDYKMALKVLLKARSNQDERAENEIRSIKERIENTASRKALSRAIRLLFKKMPSEAIRELEYSSELGNAKATYTLGAFYEFGFGVPTDKKAAYELYETAARNGFFDERNEFKKAILKLSKR